MLRQKQRSARFLPLFLSVLLLICSPASAAPQKMKELEMKKHLFAMIDQLIANLPYKDLDSCEHILSMKFSTTPQPESNKYFTVYSSASSDDPVFAKAELRANFQNLSQGQLIHLDLRKPLPVSNKDFEVHLKVIGTSMGFANPHNPDQGVYSVYRIGTPEIQLGVSFTDLDERQVNAISIDTIKN